MVAMPEPPGALPRWNANGISREKAGSVNPRNKFGHFPTRARVREACWRGRGMTRDLFERQRPVAVKLQLQVGDRVLIGRRFLEVRSVSRDWARLATGQAVPRYMTSERVARG